MGPPQQCRVLRCCSCRLFQAHQVKKSFKWTCKACGEQQSFLRAYGEGSGADCRRHVQKLNLLQGQASELSLRRRSLSTAESPRGLDVQDSGDAEVTSESQEANTGCWFPSSACGSTSEPGLWREQPGPAPPVTAPPSKWARFLLSPGNSSKVDTEPLASIQTGPRPVSPAQAEPPSEGRFCRPATTAPPPQATPGPGRPRGEILKQAPAMGTSWGEGGPGIQQPQRAPPMQLCSLFTTGEDFDDDL
ncbi:PREDICTED: UPF0544 protein C5orf45 homolog isoform X2 [Chinchilla lanigera]|uniref:UPF0544 protein C5orf45 homolog isoform X2 n=1 Tax=Chinchilla lanigera TaxID=34839 RepID=UPI00038EA42A|nr:PREDICTED: UPF0544 protein C5orf45 homolog isoform X2 [Chinchilla lanigera]